MRSFRATGAGEQSLCLLLDLVYCNLGRNCRQWCYSCRHWYRHRVCLRGKWFCVTGAVLQSIQWCYQGTQDKHELSRNHK